MTRYIFDVHDDGPANWGEETLEGADPQEIERRARELIQETQARQLARGSAKLLTTVFVHQVGNGIVLMAYGREGDDVRIRWTPSGC
ncbi:hypothetical protein GCM10007884_05780 [Methylobacterium brachythecii]|uniref:Uncharacterized protein n=1 Tax=Methylobacterium brachythecii TaxID=1176177 RepID=A0ABQ6D2T3_9HYPH|nr:hypothetical protein GCM10007884_05780 [Methylobacterium brachythecii]